MKKIIFVFLIFITSFGKALSLDELLEFTEDLYKPTIQLNYGLIYGLSATSFFETYKSVLGANTERLKESSYLGLSFKMWSSKNLRLGGSVGMYKYDCNAGYTSTHYLNGHPKYVRNVNDQISGKAVPVLFTVELAPYDKQFRSYFGLGIGAEYNNLEWNEIIYNKTEFDFRKGGKLYSNKFLSPAIKIYTGLELGFDEKPEENFLGSFIIDAAYNYTFRNPDIFKEIKKQYDLYKDIPELGEKQLIAPGYISINFSLSFNLKRNYKKT